MACELLRCILVEGSRDALLARVGELLDAACEGAAPFRILAASRTPPGTRARPYCICSSSREEPRGPRGGDSARGASHLTQEARPQGVARLGGLHQGNNKETPHAG